MSKTPVSELQELMIKRNTLPNYELLANSEGIGTHIPTFYYRVTADPVTAVGKGRSKKEAKHEAARIALEKLTELGFYTSANIHSSPIHSSTPDPSSPQKAQVNAIGALQELCMEKNIPMPEFQLIADVGPAHLRQFTVECKVATMMVTSTDTTKKRARQNAAQKMLHRLIDTLPEVIEEMSISSDCVNSFRAIEASDDIIKAYSELSSLTKKRTNWGLRISDFSKSLKNIMDEKDLKYNDLWPNVSFLDLESIEEMLNKLELKFGIDFYDQEGTVIAFISIDSDPEYVTSAIGNSRDEAKLIAVSRLLEFLQLMTK